MSSFATALSAQAPTRRRLALRTATVAVLCLMAALAAVGFATASRADSSLFNNYNTGAVVNRPSHATVFVLNATTRITTIQTYHWNGGLGAQPGTISLFEQNTSRTYGPFATTGSAGQGGRQNVNWTATLNVTLPPGSYDIRDSSPSTWSNNPQSGSRGFAAVRGDVVAAPRTPSTPSLIAACSPGFTPLPAFQPNAQLKFGAWVNPCSFGNVVNFCRRQNLSAAVVRSDFYYIGWRVYPEILAGCV